MMDNKWFPILDTQGRFAGASLIAALESDIKTGVLQPGQKLPPQRELADQLGINLSTVTRAFRVCELKGLIYGIVGRGTFVASDSRVSLSLATNDTSSSLIDMGQVLPLYSLDHIIADWVREQLPLMDIEPLMRYSQPSGFKFHREVGAQWLKEFGIHREPDNVILTPGTQNALTNCLISLFRPGDRIAVDALTYPGFKSLAAMIGLRLVPIEMTPEGMSAEGLLHACRSDGLQGIYLMPEVQNPTTLFMSETRRAEIAVIIRQYGLILMEDDAYSYTGDIGRTPVSTLVPDQGIYFAGTSKLLGPGFRITFVSVPQRYREPFEKGLLNTTWMASPINAEIITRLITSGHALKVMSLKREEASRRTAIALKRLQPFGLQVRPQGFFAWLPLPKGLTGREFELTVRAAGVQVFCAEKFAVGSGKCPSAVRISLAGPADSIELERGLNIIETVLESRGEEQISLL